MKDTELQPQKVEPRKKILFAYQNLILGGAERVLVDILGILSKYHKYDVHLLLIGDQRLANYTIPENITVYYASSNMEAEFQVYCHSKQYNESVTNKDYYRYWVDHFANAVNTRICDYINLHHFNLIINFEDHLDYFLKIYHIHPSIPVIRWIEVAWYLDRWLGDPEQHRPILEKQNPFVTICDDMYESAKKSFEQLGLSHKDIYRIYNPINFSRILSSVDDFEEADRELLDDDFILQVARLHPVKNQVRLVHCYKKLKDKGAIKEKLYIIGTGSSEIYQEIANTIKALSLENDCFLLGHRKNPYPFMKRAKLFVHTSLNEGLPTVLIESMVCGTPVVAMDCPFGPKEILSNGKYGGLVPLHDEEAFAEKVYELLTNEEKYQAYVSLLPEAVERFSAETVGNQIVELFDNLMNKQ